MQGVYLKYLKSIKDDVFQLQISNRREVVKNIDTSIKAIQRIPPQIAIPTTQIPLTRYLFSPKRNLTFVDISGKNMAVTLRWIENIYPEFSETNKRVNDIKSFVCEVLQLDGLYLGKRKHLEFKVKLPSVIICPIVEDKLRLETTIGIKRPLPKPSVDKSSGIYSKKVIKSIRKLFIPPEPRITRRVRRKLKIIKSGWNDFSIQELEDLCEKQLDIPECEPGSNLNKTEIVKIIKDILTMRNVQQLGFFKGEVARQAPRFPPPKMITVKQDTDKFFMLSVGEPKRPSGKVKGQSVKEGTKPKGPPHTKSRAPSGKVKQRRVREGEGLSSTAFQHYDVFALIDKTTRKAVPAIKKPPIFLTTRRPIRRTSMGRLKVAEKIEQLNREISRLNKQLVIEEAKLEKTDVAVIQKLKSTIKRKSSELQTQNLILDKINERLFIKEALKTKRISQEMRLLQRELNEKSREVGIAYLKSIIPVESKDNLEICKQVKKIWNTVYISHQDYFNILKSGYRVTSKNRMDFMESLERQIFLSTGKENTINYYKAIVDIYIFSDQRSNLAKYARYFNSKLFEGNESYIASLTLEQKFPEFFLNNKITRERRTVIQAMIDEKQLQQLEDLATKMAGITQLTMRIQLRPGIRRSRIDKANLETEVIPLTTICGNDISEIIEANLIIYKDKDSIYCFDQNKLKLAFEDGDIKNPFTGEDFSDQFVNNVMT